MNTIRKRKYTLKLDSLICIGDYFGERQMTISNVSRAKRVLRSAVEGKPFRFKNGNALYNNGRVVKVVYSGDVNDCSDSIQDQEKDSVRRRETLTIEEFIKKGEPLELNIEEEVTF